MLAPDALLQNRYLILRPIGKGGMGAVYEAPDQRRGNQIALKETFFEEAKKWACQLPDALDYPYTQETPIIHRDIKPQNLKWAAPGQIILLAEGRRAPVRERLRARP
jgi:serine/threonine protein kinase